MTYLVASSLDELPVDAATRIVVGGIAMAVVRTDEGVFALADRCSHADVSLAEGEVEGCALECWLHGSAFDLRTGQPLSPPATLPVATYPVRIVGEPAVVEIDPTPSIAAEDIS